MVFRTLLDKKKKDPVNHTGLFQDQNRDRDTQRDRDTEKVSKLVSWCFTPSQPVRLYQSDYGERQRQGETETKTERQRETHTDTQKRQRQRQRQGAGIAQWLERRTRD